MATRDGPPEIYVPEAFDAFYRKEYSAVVAISYAMSSSRAVAEDLAQEAFLRAHRDWAVVGAMESPGGWVRRVALNLSKSRLRRLRAETVAVFRLNASDTISPTRDPDTDSFWAEVRRLPSRQAQAIALRYVEELSLAEIASVLEIAEGTVKALLHQGRERLRRQLTAKGLIDDEV